MFFTLGLSLFCFFVIFKNQTMYNYIHRRLKMASTWRQEDIDLERDFLDSISQDDPRLIKLIRKKYLDPPSDEPYSLSTKKNDTSYWQARYVEKLLKSKKNGFFVECGAHNGEFLSNTLLFEKVHGWQGILIEADPQVYKQLLRRHRKSWTVNACLAINGYPHMAMLKKTYHHEEGVGTYWYWKIVNGTSDKGGQWKLVPCLPLYSILLAVNRTTIDYFSLDVEGNELNVLKTVPWDNVKIKVISTEFNHVDQGKQALMDYMMSIGYEVYADGAQVPHPLNIDLIFFNSKLFKNRPTLEI